MGGLRLRRGGCLARGVEVDRLSGELAEDLFECTDTQSTIDVGRSRVPRSVGRRSPEAAAPIRAIVVRSQILGVDQAVGFQNLVDGVPARPCVERVEEVGRERRVLRAASLGRAARLDDPLLFGGSCGRGDVVCYVDCGVAGALRAGASVAGVGVVDVGVDGVVGSSPRALRM